MAVAAMAKKKSAGGRKPKEGPLREEVITMRCTTAFKARLDEIADKEERSTSVVISRALRAYAEANSYEPFPER